MGWIKWDGYCHYYYYYFYYLENLMKCQILSIFEQFWTNHRLSWNPNDFGGVKSVHVEPKLIWVPDVVLYNK